MDTFIDRILSNFLIALLCVVLAACATTERSSSASGKQALAPISDASFAPQASANPGAETKTAEPNAGEAGAAIPPAAQPDSAATGGTPAPSERTEQSSSPAEGAVANDRDEAQLKRQLAEQDAEISKIRTGQQAEAARMEQQGTPDSAQAPAPAAVQAENRPAAAEPAARAGTPTTKHDDDMAVFPPAAGNADSAQAQAAVLPAMERAVYFIYDQFSIPEKYNAMLLANAAYLKANSRAKVEVQGNCDERGSREYNLALGVRRARAVKRALVLAGADGNRIEIVSFGSEKPVATGKDEESYSKNRRADIVY